MRAALYRQGRSGSMTKNGREDSVRSGLILGSEVVLRVDPDAAAAHAREAAEPESMEGRARGDQSVVLSTARSSERALLALVDGQRTVQELVRASGMSDLVVRRHLRALCDAKVLVPATLPVGVTVSPTAAREAGTDSSVPRQAPSGGSSGQNEDDGLSKALSYYLDSGKTAAVQASASDAVTAKVVPVSGLDGTSDATPPPRVVVAGVAAEAKSGSAASPGLASDATPAAAATPEAGTKRTESPAAGVVTSEWPRPSNKLSALKPNVTAFWIPASSEPGSGETMAGPPAAAAAAPTSAVGPAPAASPTSAPVPAPAAARGAGPVGPGLSPSTTQMWHRSADSSILAALRAAPRGQETIIVTGSPGLTGSPSAVDSSQAAFDVTPAEVLPSSAGGAGSSRGRSAAIPFRLGEYEVATRIAQGGMGSIYVCRRAGATGPQRLFTLKVIRQHARQVTQVIQSFRREARVGALLSHPNLQTVVHVGTYHEQPFLILDYIEGIGLADLMASPKRLPPAIVVSVLVDVLRGLKAAHDLVDEQGTRLGLVHGDISPHNMLVGVDGNARLTDFGSARFSSEARAPAAAAAVLMGKAAFMSPEQLCADPIDARTDLFSIGVVLWSALTGQVLFAADTYDEIVMNIFRKKVPPPSEFGAPACFDEILTTALSRAPDGRYSTAEEMANALSRAARNEGIVGSPYDVGQWVRREFAETLAERRRRIQVVFGGLGTPSGAAAMGAPAAAPPPAADAAPASGPENPGVSSADGFPRLSSRTIQLPARRRSTPRLTTLTTPAPMSPENRWRLVFVSAAIAFPFALALAYLVSNPLVKRVRGAHAPPATAGAAPLAPASQPGVAPPTATTAPGTPTTDQH